MSTQVYISCGNPGRFCGKNEEKEKRIQEA
jgi:hypothetical protein